MDHRSSRSFGLIIEQANVDANRRAIAQQMNKAEEETCMYAI